MNNYKNGRSNNYKKKHKNYLGSNSYYYYKCGHLNIFIYMKEYSIFKERHIPFIKELITLALKKNKKFIVSPFDNMEEISLSDCRRYINTSEGNEDQDG